MNSIQFQPINESRPVSIWSNDQLNKSVSFHFISFHFIEFKPINWIKTGAEIQQRWTKQINEIQSNPIRAHQWIKTGAEIPMTDEAGGLPSAPMETSLTPLLAIKSRALLTLAILWKRILPRSGLGSVSPEITSRSSISFRPLRKSSSMFSMPVPALRRCELHHAVNV